MAALNGEGAAANISDSDVPPSVRLPDPFPKNTMSQEAYWLLNARLAYRTPDGRIEVAGWVRNFTDESYKSFGFDASTFNNTSIYFVGDPRTYGLSLNLNF